MYATRAVEDPARRWRRFCRTGSHLAVGFAALWFGGLTLLFRLAPALGPLPHAAPMPVSWWPAAEESPLDIRALWSPSLFALPSPAGFSHALRKERVRLAPPVQAMRPAPAYLKRAPSPEGIPLTHPSRIWLTGFSGSERLAPGAGVFPPRRQARETARMVFPPGWESRLFAGIDLDYGSWTNAAWSARVEMQFDRNGVPVCMLLAKSSGLPEVDSRLARSVHGWRLLEPEAPRTGGVSWNNPAAEPEAPGAPPSAATRQAVP